jgi:hypothetical protein
MQQHNHTRIIAGAPLAPCLALLAAATLVFAAPCGAQPDATPAAGTWAQDRGFSLGLQFQSNVIGASDPDADADENAIFVDETGSGATFHIGYTFVPAFNLRLAIGIARHETTREAVEAFYNSVAIEAHWRFLPQERARPYIYGALGGAGFMFDTDEYDSEVSGGVAALGFGLLYNLTRHLLIDLNTRLDLINWSEATWTRKVPGGGEVSVSAPIDDDGSAWRFQLGLAWEF